MVKECHICGESMEEDTPLSAMGEPMYGRGVEIYRCANLDVLDLENKIDNIVVL